MTSALHALGLVQFHNIARVAPIIVTTNVVLKLDRSRPADYWCSSIISWVGFWSIATLSLQESRFFFSVKDWIGQSRGSLISSGVRKEHGLLFDSCHNVLAVVVAWSQSIRRLQTITYHYLLNLLSHPPTPVDKRGRARHLTERAPG